jgi:predicted transcriptional regulator
VSIVSSFIYVIYVKPKDTGISNVPLRLAPSLARLEALARSTTRSKSFLAAEAIAAYVELNEWQIGEIAAGLAELDTGEALSEEQAAQRYRRLLQPR